MATDKSQNMDAFGRQELGWVVPEVLDSSRTETGIPDSKVDIGAITWQKPDGTPYTLTDGAGRHRAQLPDVRRQAARPSAARPGGVHSGDGATPRRTPWWSRSGNDFGCTPLAGTTSTCSIPELADVPTRTATVTLELQVALGHRVGLRLRLRADHHRRRRDLHLARVEERLHDRRNTDPAGDRPTTSCQDTYSNGLTGTSGSYDAGHEAVDRARQRHLPARRSSSPTATTSATWPARRRARCGSATPPTRAWPDPGWFIDDVKVTVDPTARRDAVAGRPRHRLRDQRRPDDPRIFNGGCREDLTTAHEVHRWAGSTSRPGRSRPADHAYYMEMRDRSGFDFEGHGPDRPRPDRVHARLLPGLHRRGARLRQRRHRRPAGPVPAGLGAAARESRAEPQRRGLRRRRPPGRRTRTTRRRRTSTTTPTRAASRATGSSATTASASTSPR